MPTNPEPKWTIAQANAAEKTFRDFKLPANRRYGYTQLGPREIRLLKVSLPATPDSMPWFELESTALDSAPPFRALSYCWGKQNKPFHKVPITDRHDTQTRQGQLSWIGVTQSLAQMLAHLPRHCIPSGATSSYIWIDQLCINQNNGNSGEKTDQIKLMGEIYSRATQVLIWLGPGPDPAAAERIANIDILRMLPSSTEQKSDIGYIWTNAWFDRTWVVQEYCLARDRRLLVGLHAITWDSNAKQVSAQIFARRLPSLSIDIDISAITRHIVAVTTWQKFEEMSDHCDVSRGILLCSFLARCGQDLNATDPRDKVLAFMSLWNPPSFHIPATSGKHVDQVYTRFARSLVKDTKRLDILAALRSPIQGVRPSTYSSLCSCRTAGDTLQPSWVPRWDEKKISPPSPLMAATYSSTTLRNPLSTRPDRTASLLTPSTIQWNASYPHDEHKNVSQEDLEDLTLTTRGKILSRIQDVFPRITHHPHTVSEHAIEQFQSSLKSKKNSVEIREAMKTIIECTELGRTDEISGSGILTDFQRLSSNISPVPADPQDGDPTRSIKLFDSTGRRFFTTTWPDETQTLHGLGPGWTEIGDDIAILHGARFPVILRKNNEEPQTYHVVGDCCVPGIMRGEAVRWAEEEADNISLL